MSAYDRKAFSSSLLRLDVLVAGRYWIFLNRLDWNHHLVVDAQLSLGYPFGQVRIWFGDILGKASGSWQAALNSFKTYKSFCRHVDQGRAGDTRKIQRWAVCLNFTPRYLEAECY